MKQLLTFLVIALSMLSVSVKAQTKDVLWQDNPTFKPFVAFAIAPYNNSNSWVAFEAGLGNKSWQFKGGVTGGLKSGIVDKDNTILLVGVSHRLIRIWRFEEWGGLSYSQSLTGRLPLNTQAQLLTRLQIDKAVNIFGGVGTSEWWDGPLKWNGFARTFGVQVRFGGNVHSKYDKVKI